MPQPRNGVVAHEGQTQETLAESQYLQGQTKIQNMPKSACFYPMSYLFATYKKKTELITPCKPLKYWVILSNPTYRTPEVRSEILYDSAKIGLDFIRQ